MPSKSKQTPDPASVPETGTPKPEASTDARTLPSLTPLQLMLSDELADIVSNGSEETPSVALVLTAVAHHREYRRGGKNWQTTSTGLSNPSDWRIDLEPIWKARRLESAESQSAATATARDRLRTCVTDNMKAYFRRFIDQSTPEERDLLSHALELHYSAALPDAFDECHLATILDAEINDRQSTFLRVPEKLRDQMEIHLKLLIRAEKCAAA
jgi:hypothetical protein